MSTIHAYRAAFGIGFVLLGAVTVWRVATASAATGSKVLGLAFGIGIIALGAARIVQYVRARRSAP